MDWKRALVWIAALMALLAGCARAGAARAECWTTPEDACYHLDPGCGGDVRRYPMSLEAAAAFDKAPCPRCAEGRTEITACARYGTYVFRVPQALLDRAELVPTPAVDVSDAFAGDAEARLAAVLTEAERAAFLADWRAGGRAEAVVRAAALDAAQGQLNMNVRRVGDFWYLLADPERPFSRKRPLAWRVVELEIRMDASGALTWLRRGEALRRDYIPAEDMNAAACVFERAYEGMDVGVYHELGGNIAVLHARPATDDLALAVRIGDSERGAQTVAGYRSGGGATYCFVVSDAELGALVAGTVPELRALSPAEGVAFDNGDYAPARRVGGGMGLIDRSGRFVVEPVYRRVGDGGYVADRGACAALRPYFMTDTEGGVTVLDPETLAELGSYPAEPGELVTPRYENPAVAVLESPARSRVISLEDGALLWTLPAGPEDGRASVSGVYAGFVSGMPGRLVVTRGAGEDAAAWLADNAGNRITGDYRRVVPLVWNGAQGAFSVEPLDGGGLVGLIDQDGQPLAEAAYDAIAARSLTLIELTRAGETTFLELDGAARTTAAPQTSLADGWENTVFDW